WAGEQRRRDGRVCPGRGGDRRGARADVRRKRDRGDFVRARGGEENVAAAWRAWRLDCEHFVFGRADRVGGRVGTLRGQQGSDQHFYDRPGAGGCDRGYSGERGRAGAGGDGSAWRRWRAAAFGAIDADNSDGKSGKARRDCRGNRLVAVLRGFLCYGGGAGGGRREIIIPTVMLSAAGHKPNAVEDFGLQTNLGFLRGLCSGGL